MTQNPNTSKKKTAWSLPHPIVMLCCIILIVFIAGFIVPAGQYDKILNESTGRMVADPSSFHYVEREAISFTDAIMSLFQAVPKGLAQGQDIVFFILLVAGAFNIITSTGAIEAGIGRLAVKLSNNEKFMIPALIALFAAGGATFGMSEENVIFVPICIALARALGYDAMVGMAVAVMGAACGFCAGVINPFTIGVAQGIAELPTFSGIGYRLIILAVMCVITSAYIMRYAEKVRKNPAASYIADVEKSERHTGLDLSNLPEMTGRHIAVLVTVLLGFGILIYGVLVLEWYITELCALFFAMGIVSGFIFGYTPNEIVKNFLDGVRGIAAGAIMVGFARAILVVMTDAMIIDTLVNALSGFISALPTAISALGMYLVQIVINFFIPSGSGQAAATMPIMVPLADVVGINRQVAVLCYQFGDGFTNNILPTGATLMAILSLSKISYDRWLKFAGPLVGIWIGLGAGFIVIANMINYGPF